MSDPDKCLFYREFAGGGSLPGRFSVCRPGDWLRADVLTGWPGQVRSLFKESVKFERIPFGPGHDERGLEVLVSPLSMRRRHNRAAPSMLYSLAADCKHFESTAALPITNDESCQTVGTLAPRGLPSGPEWVRELYNRRPVRGWSQVDTGGPCVVWPGVTALSGDLPTVGIVVTVFNKPDRFMPCLRSIQERTVYPDMTVFIVNDGSDEHSTGLINAEYAGKPGVTIIGHTNQGYLATANRGIDAAFASGCDFVVVVNSDVRVTHGWLSAMVRAAIKTDSALVNPLCNQQGPLSLPLALEKSWNFPRLAGRASYIDAAIAASFVPPAYPEAVTSVGQCLMIRRDAWRQHGPFDADLYGSGYGEECELWARVVSSGGGAVVADDAYVYHESHATHANADARERAGAELFISRWKKLYGAKSIKVRSWPTRCQAVRGAVNDLKPTGCPIRFIMMNIGQYGGVYCVLRLVDELNERGFNASAEFTKLQPHEYRLTTGPNQHRDQNSLRRLADDPNCAGGFIVGTHWFTGELLQANMRRNNESFIPLAFWQDREDMFVAADGSASVRPGSVEAYIAIKNRIVNAAWVGESAVEDLGIDQFTHIPVGVDCHKFYPGDGRKQGPVRVLAMHRPSTPRRGAKALRAAYVKLKATMGHNIMIETYGEDCTWSDYHYGQLSQDDIASLLRQIDIVIEPSEFQGFGLPGLEAMASGVALVSTDNRGIDEYGLSGRNCLIVGEDGGIVEHTLKLAQDSAYRAKLAAAGRETALRFDWGVIADRWCAELARIYSASNQTRYQNWFALQGWQG